MYYIAKTRWNEEVRAGQLLACNKNGTVSEIPPRKLPVWKSIVSSGLSLLYCSCFATSTPYIISCRGVFTYYITSSCFYSVSSGRAQGDRPLVLFCSIKRGTYTSNRTAGVLENLPELRGNRSFLALGFFSARLPRAESDLFLGARSAH